MIVQHFPQIVWVYLHSSFSFGLRKTFFPARVRFDRSRSSKVIDFGTNRKGCCDVLLVRHSILGPNLHRFGDIADFCAYDQPYFTLIFGVFPLHQIGLW